MKMKIFIAICILFCGCRSAAHLSKIDKYQFPADKINNYNGLNIEIAHGPNATATVDEHCRKGAKTTDSGDRIARSAIDPATGQSTDHLIIYACTKVFDDMAAVIVLSEDHISALLHELCHAFGLSGTNGLSDEAYCRKNYPD